VGYATSKSRWIRLMRAPTGDGVGVFCVRDAKTQVFYTFPKSPVQSAAGRSRSTGSASVHSTTCASASRAECECECWAFCGTPLPPQSWDCCADAHGNCDGEPTISSSDRPSCADLSLSRSRWRKGHVRHTDQQFLLLILLMPVTSSTGVGGSRSTDRRRPRPPLNPSSEYGTLRLILRGDAPRGLGARPVPSILNLHTSLMTFRMTRSVEETD